MQPNDKRARLQKATLPRCRMVLKTYLPFLPGFPMPESSAQRDSRKVAKYAGNFKQSSADFAPLHETNLSWYSVGEKGYIQLTAESIRLANFGWNELQKFPLVFPQAVEDSDAWQRVVPWLLDELGKAVYGKTSLPDALWSLRFGFSASDCRHARELTLSEPKLKPLLDAVSWLTALQPDRVTELLKWLESERETAVSLLDNWPGADGIQLTLLLFRLVEQDGVERLAPILQTLGTKNARSVATSFEPFRNEWNKVLTAIAQRTRTPKSFNQPQKEFTMESPAKPAGEWADAVCDFTKRIAGQPTKQRRLALELFAEYIPPNFVERWRCWWNELEPVIWDAEKLVTRVRKRTYEDNAKRSRQAAAIQRRFSELCRLAPTALEYSRCWSYTSTQILDLFVNWDDLEWKSCQKSIRSWTRTLAIEHRQQTPRLATLVSLYAEFCYGNKPGIDTPLIINEMRQWDIPQHDIPSVINVDWSETYSGTRDELKRIGKALRYWFVDLEQSKYFGCVIELAKAIQDETRIHLFSRVLARPEHRNSYYNDAILHTAARLADTEKEFAQLLTILKKINQDEEDSIGENAENLSTLTRILVPMAWRDDLRDALLNNDVSKVLDLAEAVAFLEKRKVAMPLPGTTEPVATDWIQQYPERFADTLQRLATLIPDAEDIALRKLEVLMFIPEAIEAEIRFLERRVIDFPDNTANARIQKRIANLRARLQNGPPAEPTESRLRQLHKKLAERTRQIFFEQFHRLTNDILEQTLCRELGLTSISESWREPLHRKIVLGILELDTKSVKRLGIKLLRSVAGAEPWDYRHEHENVKFVNRLRELGLNPEPWLVPAPAERHVPFNCPPLLLSFENDPMEVMKMGAPFGTCLSPWNFNFFSTVANTVDINKRVLYARDVKGAIKARCLIALTDNGELLAFHPYAHDKAFGFQEMVADYLERLAKRMNTVVINEGNVSNLVSPEWYDDGAITISGLFTFLKDGTEFRKKLPTMESAALVTELEKQLSPHPLRPFILPPFLELPEVEQRPEFVLPLIPCISSALSAKHLAKMIRLVDQAGRKHEAAQLTKQYMLPRMDRLLIDEYWTWKSVVSDLAKIFPEAFLPYIRRLGSRGTRKLSEEQTSDRRELLVMIYETLGRKRKADLYR